VISLYELTIGELAAYIRWSANEGFAEVFEKNVSKRLSEKLG